MKSGQDLRDWQARGEDMNGIFRLNVSTDWTANYTVLDAITWKR